MTTWFVGAYTADMGGTATGIAALTSRADGSLEYLGTGATTASPSYLAASADHVYAVSEGAGRVEVFERAGSSGMTYVTGAASGGESPCHISIMGDRLLVSNYSSGSIGVVDSASLELVQVLDGEGNGPHEAQEGPHAHSTLVLTDGTILVADLGADRIHVHRIENGRLVRVSSLTLPPGTGPRDIRQHPSGMLLLLAELGLEVVVLQISDGELSIVNSFPIPGAEAGDHAAEISLSDDAASAFVGLRGSNRIAVFAVSADARMLTAVAAYPSGGDWPRHHVVDGDVLHVANQFSNSIASFRIAKNGAISLIAEPISVPSPTFLLRG